MKLLSEKEGFGPLFAYLYILMMSLIKLLRLEARKTTAEASDEGLALWDGIGAFALLDFNRAILSLAKVPDERLKYIFATGKSAWSTEKKTVIYEVGADELGRFLHKSCKLICGSMFYGQRAAYLPVWMAAAEKGYGPMLYFILSKKSPSGFIGSDSSVRPSAQAVWEKFYQNKSVERKIRPDVARFAEQPSKALKYIYKIKDSKTNVSRLKQEYKIGLEDFQEQLTERLCQIYSQFDEKYIAEYVDRLPFSVAVEQAASLHFKDFYDKAFTVQTSAGEVTMNAKVPYGVYDASTDFTGEMKFPAQENFAFPTKAQFFKGKLQSTKDVPSVVGLLAPNVEQRMWHDKGVLVKLQLVNQATGYPIMTNTYTPKDGVADPREAQLLVSKTYNPDGTEKS